MVANVFHMVTTPMFASVPRTGLDESVKKSPVSIHFRVESLAVWSQNKTVITATRYTCILLNVKQIMNILYGLVRLGVGFIPKRLHSEQS